MSKNPLPDSTKIALAQCGQFGKTVGLKGDIRFFPSSGQLDTIGSLKRLYTENQTVLSVESVQLRPDFLVLRFEGYSCVESVTPLVNTKAYLNKADLPKLEKGRYYWFELLNLEVIHGDSQSLGVVQRIYSNGPQDILCTSSGQQIPFVFDEVIKSVDMAQSKIFVDFDVVFFED